MKMVELGKICKIVSGSTPSRNTPEFWDGDIHWFTPKDLSGLASKYVYEAPEKITKEGFRSCSTNLIPSNSLLFSSRAPIGHLAINKLECCTNQGFKTMIPSENLNVEYLYYAIKRIVPQLQDMGNGATFKELSKSTFEKVEIPLPPLATQQKIAAILDAADAYRQKTKTLIAKYDQLAQSLFLDMFGKNSGKEISFNDLADKSNKGTFSNGPFGSDLLTSELTTAGVPVIYIRDLRNGQYNWKSKVYVTHKKAEELINCQVRLNDVLIAKVGDPPGIAAIYSGNDELAVITQDVVRLRVNTKIVSPKFIQFWFNSQIGQVTLKSIIVEGTRKRFGLGDLKKTKINVPPITLQTQFAERIQLLEAQKQQAQASLQKAEELFNSLLYRCFGCAQQPRWLSEAEARNFYYLYPSL